MHFVCYHDTETMQPGTARTRPLKAAMSKSVYGCGEAAGGSVGDWR